ncbi:MAG: hypothetical protein AB1637_08720 [Elusimicrobiota bacterium]
MKNILPLIAVSLSLSACATGYGRGGGLSHGFTDSHLQGDTFLISFSGNGFTGMGRVKDYALLRCAEVAMNNGYVFFIIEKSKTRGAFPPFLQKSYAEYSIRGMNAFASGAYDARNIAETIRAKYGLNTAR